MFKNLIVKDKFAQFDLNENHHLFHCFSIISAGNMSYSWGEKEEVDINIENFYRLIETDRKKRISILPQHKNKIVIVDERDSGKTLECDGLITESQNIALSLCPADCVPIIITNKESRDNNFVSLIHAGARSTNLKIVKKAINLIACYFDVKPSQLLVLIGPGIHKCCYNSWKMAIRLLINPSWRHDINGFYIDLINQNKKQIQGSGVLEDNIIIASECTCCKYDENNKNYLFFSHNRSKKIIDKKEGRLVSIVSLKTD